VKKVGTFEGLAVELNRRGQTDIFTRDRIREWWRARKIPGQKIGYRTVIFDVDQVETALNRFTQKAVTA
jgi:hypothetical protein